MKTRTHDDVQAYYGHILSGKNDLKTTACCAAASPPAHIAAALRKVPEEIQSKFYGCGTPFPSSVKDLTVLDLGSGTGRDCYVLSQLVGEQGRVVGVDMTENQLAVAKKHVEAFTKGIGFKKPNMDFRLGLIEDLASADISDSSMDLVISNCVVNLSPRKDLVLREIFRVLKPGGELYFSDVFASRRLSSEVQKDPVLVGECLGGALYKEDFRRLMWSVGFADFRVVAKSPVEVTNTELRQKIGPATFESITIRAFKLPLEDACEDYGQTACYLGTDPAFPSSFVLDDHHSFEKGKWLAICRNTAHMLADTRFSRHFDVRGEATTHFGLFDCTNKPGLGAALSQGALAAPALGSSNGGGACC
jgi:ubiquinone/menaquinone biosynthesis C-methylase UbiE